MKPLGWTCCAALRSHLNPSGMDEGKGLSAMIAYEYAGHFFQRPTLIGFSYRKKAQAMGTLINHCPWCGVSLKFWDELVTPPSTGKTEPPAHTD